MLKVGGDIEIETSLLLSPKQRELSGFSQGALHIWTDTGRSAISIAIDDILKKGCNKKVYLPAFSCDSVIQPFLEKEFSISYYSMGEDLNTPSSLPEKLSNEIFLFIHYFGKENKAIKRWLKNQLKESSFYVIEDCVQAAFSTFGNEIYDYKVYSYRKFTPQPDGALLVSKNKLCHQPLLNKKSSEFVTAQIKGKFLRSFSTDEKTYLTLLKSSESSLENKIIPREISPFSSYLMERLDIKEIKAKRKENWSLLYKEVELNLVEYIKPVIKEFSSEEVPLGFPIFVFKRHRDDLRQFLIQKNIFCPIHWTISCHQYKEDLQASSVIMTLPIDQRMNKQHIRYMVESISLYFKGVGK